MVVWHLHIFKETFYMLPQEILQEYCRVQPSGMELRELEGVPTADFNAQKKKTWSERTILIMQESQTEGGDEKISVGAEDMQVRTRNNL
jgi:hypothetical protein